MTRKETKEKLINYLLDYEAQIKALESVKRLHKKDGSDFAIKSKNFEGGAFGKYYPVETSTNPYFTIDYIWSDIISKKHYNEINIQMFKYWDEMTNEEKKGKEETKGESWSRSTYIFNLDEIEERIKKTLLNTIERKNYIEEQIALFDELADNLEKHITNIKEFFKNDVFNNKFYKFKTSNSLKYALIDYLKEEIQSYNL